MENIQVISNRASILIKDQIFSLVILPTSDKKKTNLLFLWLFAWSVSGVIVLANYFKLTQDNAKMMIIVWLAFWAYFEFKIVRVYMWKRFGKEKLWVKNGSLQYQQDINGRGKIKEFDLNLISEISVIELVNGSIADTFSQTFWVKGGERLEFTCQGKVIKIGMQLEDKEASKITTAINKFLKK
jgi:hypothetical protein